MRVASALLLIPTGLLLLAFGAIGLLFVLSGEPPDAAALSFTGGCVILAVAFCGLGLKRLLKRP